MIIIYKTFFILLLALFISTSLEAKIYQDKLKSSLKISLNKTSIKISNKSFKSNNDIIKQAKRYLGIKYKYGANPNSTKRFDCSSFVKRVYKNEVNLPRTTRDQIKLGKRETKNTAKKGDLIFFGDSKNYVGHVGIILDPKKKIMIHASSVRGKVTIGSYDTKYFRKKYRGIRRLT